MAQKNLMAFATAILIVFGIFAAGSAPARASDCANVDAGADKTADVGESIRLDGSVDGDYGSVSWSCTGGTVTGGNSLRPVFRAMDFDFDYNDIGEKTFTCTLTAYGSCGSDSDAVKVRVTGGKSKLKVALIARPKSECAPANNIDLIATVTGYGSDNRGFTYSFDCENDGVWEKTVTTDDTDYTATDLCDYRNIGSYTARVEVSGRGRSATDTDIIKAEDCRDGDIQEVAGRVSITKTVRNATRGLGYQGTVAANPSDVVSYRIVVEAVSGVVNDIVVTDYLPAGIAGLRNLRIDGAYLGGNLASGINIGSLSAGRIRTITYDATVAGSGNFNYGQTNMANTATVRVNGNSANSSAAVQVYRTAIQGATVISTGIGGDGVAGLAMALAAALFCLAWIFRKKSCAGRSPLQEKTAWLEPF
jgi:hypothetical protein